MIREVMKILQVSANIFLLFAQIRKTLFKYRHKVNEGQSKRKNLSLGNKKI